MNQEPSDNVDLDLCLDLFMTWLNQVIYFSMSFFLFQMYLYLLYYAMILGVGLFAICSCRQDEHQNLQDSRPTQNLSYL